MAAAASFAARVAARVTAIFAASLVAGCASAPPPAKPTEIGLDIQAAANLNPSVSRRPSPLLLRVYELKAATAFGNADFVSLYQGDQAVLGGEMVSREEYVLSPGATTPVASKPAAAETRFIGVFAAYRDLDRAKWRSVVAVQPGQKQRILINADELTVSASNVPAPAATKGAGKPAAPPAPAAANPGAAPPPAGAAAVGAAAAAAVKK